MPRMQQADPIERKGNGMIRRLLALASVLSLVLCVATAALCDGHHFELNVRGKGRMKVAADVFQRIESLREALLAINTDIQFGQRDGSICGLCRGSIFPPGGMPSIRDIVRITRGGVCPLCGEPFPKYGRFV